MNNAPKPTALREFEGDLSKGKNKSPISEPIPVTPMAPEPPSWLNDGGKAKWSELYPEFAAMSMLKFIDTAKFAQYCQMVSDFEMLTKAINEEGYTKMSPNSRGQMYEMQNPKALLRNQIWPQLKVLGELFGDTPSSRVRIGRDLDNKSMDAFDAFHEGGE